MLSSVWQYYTCIMNSNKPETSFFTIVEARAEADRAEHERRVDALQEALLRNSESLEAATQKRLSQRQDEDLDPIPPFQCQVCRGKITQRNLISCQSRPNAADERDCGKIAVTQLTLFSLIQ